MYKSNKKVKVGVLDTVTPNRWHSASISIVEDIYLIKFIFYVLMVLDCVDLSFNFFKNDEACPGIAQMTT